MSKDINKTIVYSALEVANICGVVNQTAINWIRNGYLKAFSTPGGQYRIYLDDYYDIPKEARGNPFITPAIVTAEAKKSGGTIKAQNSAKLLSKVNQSGANFVKRLLDPDRKSIPD